ncbi:MAG: hypothetical protein ACLQIB_21275, partial [Isosphaeraceae bacterium]
MEPFAARHVSGLARATMSGAAAAVSFWLAPGFGTFGRAPLLDVGGSRRNGSAPFGLGLIGARVPPRLTLGSEVRGGRDFSGPFPFTPASADRGSTPAAGRQVVEWRRFFKFGFDAGLRRADVWHHIQIERSLFFGRWERM